MFVKWTGLHIIPNNANKKHWYQQYQKHHPKSHRRRHSCLNGAPHTHIHLCSRLCWPFQNLQRSAFFLVGWEVAFHRLENIVLFANARRKLSRWCEKQHPARVVGGEKRCKKQVKSISCCWLWLKEIWIGFGAKTVPGRRFFPPNGVLGIQFLSQRR